jgi:hypothetical protein
MKLYITDKGRRLHTRLLPFFYTKIPSERGEEVADPFEILDDLIDNPGIEEEIFSIPYPNVQRPEEYSQNARRLVRALFEAKLITNREEEE